MPKKKRTYEYYWEAPEIVAAIEALSVEPKPGVDAVFEKVLQAHLADLADAQPDGAKIPLQGPVTLFAHSYAGVYAMSVSNEEAGRGFTGGLTLTSDISGEFFNVSGDMAFSGRDGGCILAGRGALVDQELVLSLDVSDAGRPLGFDARLGPDLPFEEDWLPAGTIQCQQAPDDPGLNGDIILTPDGKQAVKKRVVLSVIKVPRRDARGRPVTTGTGDKKKPVYDCYIWRDGKWWKIKDPTLKLRDDPTLIDLRDGTGNPNYEPAGKGVSDRLDRQFFPTGWQDFWKGFDAATARQLQGLAITLGALTGTDLMVWRKIRRLRDEGKSWSQVWDACWFDIMIVVGLMAFSVIPLARILRRIFGPFIGRFTSRFLSSAGRTRPPLPLGKGRQFGDWVYNQWLDFVRRQKDLIRRYNDLQRRARRSSSDAERFRRMGPRLQDQIQRIGGEIDRLRKVLERMGLL